VEEEEREREREREREIRRKKGRDVSRRECIIVALKALRTHVSRERLLCVQP